VAITLSSTAVKVCVSTPETFEAEWETLGEVLKA
jgi:hypothetical protein